MGFFFANYIEMEDVVSFWNNKSFSKPHHKQHYFQERIKIESEYLLARKILAKFTPMDEFRPAGAEPVKTLSLKDSVALRKDLAKSDAVAGNDINSDNDQAPEGSRILPPQSGFTEEEQEMLSQFQNEVSKKYLEMYFDAYMAPVHSDIQWRLGNVTGIYMATEDIDDPTGMITPEGKIYTRSNMHLNFQVPQYIGGRILNQDMYYSNLFFPPYRIGSYNSFKYKTNIMPEILKDTPDATFNQDEFSIKREGFTYREPGFKSINDNIMFIQWLLEQTTGIVSTYLTEWDLSVYMQEGMIAPAPNGGPLRLYLNYRVRSDNPLADKTTGYTGNKAFSFSVVNSAVSKLDFDCQKPWRPSDFPLSTYWLPYQRGVDWTLMAESIEDPITEEKSIIFYGSWANEKMMFDFENSSLKDILRHQDFIGMALGSWPTPNPDYYQALYYTDADAYGENEIWQQSWLKKIAGADSGVSTANGKNLQHWLSKSRMDTISMGGINGSMAGAGMGGIAGGGGSKSLKKVMDKVASGFDEDEAAGNEKANEMKQAKAGAGSNLSETLTGGPIAGSGGKVDASTMSNLNGVNRFSPALFGGPHGANYSPHSLQAFFEVNNKFLRNTPRLSANNANNFTSTNDADLFEGVNIHYQNQYKTGISPTKALGILNSGITNYTIDFLYEEFNKVDLIQGEIKFNVNGTWYYKFPEVVQGQRISYTGDPILKPKTDFVPFTIWGNTLFDRTKYWNQFYSYWNQFNIRRGPVVKNGQLGYDTTTYEVYRYGIVKSTRIKPFKKYLLHDEPDVKWTIYQHKFLNYTSDNSKNSPLWKLMDKLKGVIGIRQQEEYRSVIESQQTVFVLKFNDDDIERNFIDKMIKQGRNYTAGMKVPLIFCEGNETQRYKFGPSSIFVANVSIDYYTSLYTMPKRKVAIPGAYNFDYKVWEKIGKGGFTQRVMRIFAWMIQASKWRASSRVEYETAFRHTPYIKVDLQKGVSFFADCTNRDGYSNRYKGTFGTALELDSIPQDNDYIDHATDILQKFKVRGYNTVGSYQYEKKYDNIVRSMVDKVSDKSLITQNMVYGTTEQNVTDWWIKDPSGTKFLIDGTPVSDSPSVLKGNVGWTDLPPGNNPYQVKGVKYPHTETFTFPKTVKRYPEDIMDDDGVTVLHKKGDYDLDPNTGEFQYDDHEPPSLDITLDPMNGAGLPLKAYPPVEGTPVRNTLFPWPEKNTYQKPGYVVRRYDPPRDVNLPADLYSGPEGLNKKTIWESRSVMGISGIGILSQIQGIGPSQIETSDSQYINYRKLMTVDQKTLNLPLGLMGYKTHVFIDHASERSESKDGIVFYVPGGVPSYREKDMDIGLKYAISGLGTKSTFYKEEQGEKEYLINLDTQFRIFYNLVSRQLTFLKVIKENFIDMIDFEIMRKMLLECVDKCVVKTAGLTVDGFTSKDKTHVLYNYWIDCAVSIFGDAIKNEDSKQRIIDLLNEKIYRYEWAVSVLEEPIKNKNIRDWSWMDIKNSYNAVTMLSDEMKTTDFERYMFAYLNCLYYYRLFFVGKRFNKEDGTMWVMRALESCIDLIAPYPSNNNPPNLSKLSKKENSLTISFYELQNTSEMKKQAILTGVPLEEDRIKAVYVKVKWVTIKEFDDWTRYVTYPRKYPPSPKVIEVEKKVKNKTIIKYAELPMNGIYTLISKEYLDNLKDVKYNNTHPKARQRWTREDVDPVEFKIEWGTTYDQTPIRWNIFSNLVVDNVLRYSTDSISPEELLCLSKDGTDYWTVNIPEELWPRATAYQTKMKLKHYDPQVKTTHLLNDPIITLEGSMGYQLFPITENQERPFPGVGAPDAIKSMIPPGF